MNLKNTLQDTHKIMSPEEMKKVLGGGFINTHTVYCHCMGREEPLEVTGEEGEDVLCKGCPTRCAEIALEAQNCTYTVKPQK